MSDPNKKRDLLVFHRGALGDLLISLPFLAALPAHFGVKSLELVGQNKIIKLFANQPFVKVTFDQDRAFWAGLYSDPPKVSAFLATLLEKCVGAVVFSSLAYNSNKPENKWPDSNELVRNELVRNELGSGIQDPLVKGLWMAGLKNIMIAPSRPIPGTGVHLLDQMFESTKVPRLIKKTVIIPKRDALEKAKIFLSENGLKQDSFLTIHPGSGGVFKNWGEDNWLNLIGEIRKKFELPVVIILGPAETGMADFVRRAKSGLSGVITAIDFSLPDITALISMSKFHLGQDTGISHLAASLGKAGIALFGPTDPSGWAPGNNFSFISPPTRIETANLEVLPKKEYDWSWLDPDMILSMLADFLA